MTFRPEYYPRIEDDLRLFILCVERGQMPPAWLMRFMADGAREFIKGGKPWQKKDGRPQAGYGEKEIEAYVLKYYGKLNAGQILQLSDHPSDGKDYTKTIKRKIKRGELAYCMAKINQVDGLKALFRDLSNLPFDDLSVEVRDRCRANLLAELHRLERDEQEPGYSDKN